MSENLVATYTLGNKTLKIVVDPEPDDPREWGNVGTLWLFHKRLDLGDKRSKYDPTPQDFASWEEFDQHLYAEKDAAVVLPVYIYQHGGVTISTEPFNDRFDSGRAGMIWVSKTSALHEWNAEELTDEIKAKLIERLTAEVAVYDDYLTGAVYGAIVYENGEETDSLWCIYETGNREFEGCRAFAFGDKWKESVRK